ncbi:uncharacterized protein KY384_008236 [Bacidia gigantensis]|uniref:uncharacterized protein n=1 Tax=Bacidia gigantensis TaxID=2732470 RepID=UPI001D03A602|nr:uncharacterized protein KY384_008236 [Bacidia gigantensis]KAG8526807.1 hypothetical protein KY384_008236 [Bacidia gigantensis]
MEVPRNSNLRRSSNTQERAPFVRRRKRIILCFDGTGNKFQGTDTDSNILKIYRMLDRNNGDKHYYQPGIGTYVNTKSLSHTSTMARFHSWYMKAKDSAVGTSFDDHVMGAYKFLMSCYDDDDIYFFGFSRGAYVARFLAEMLDHVGLLSRGNEEMARFAWKSFSQWQERDESTDEEKAKKKEMLRFLKAFRVTFGRPVRRIRFLGLFDTVNSVPRFENAWMQRSKFPYTARSSAKVIRHAVSIDERRAKFRQDLISEVKGPSKRDVHQHHFRHARKPMPTDTHRNVTTNGLKPNTEPSDRFRRRSNARGTSGGRSTSPAQRLQGERGRQDTLSPETSSLRSTASSYLPDELQDFDDELEIDESAQADIEELWFPGCHADLGGGWPAGKEEESPLSHVPLVWMVREAQRAGLEFDAEQMVELKCCDDTFNSEELSEERQGPAPPDITVTRSDSDMNIFSSPKSEKEQFGWAPGMAPEPPKKSVFHHTLEVSATKGTLHDCLVFNNGLTHASVISWKIMEYLPFRRMDLQVDGSWKAISFPLPMGEVRDIPEDAWIHHSAIQRMKADPNYRPGNLIVGGGGRGMRRAPEELGIGQWDLLKSDNDPVGMVYVRKGESLNHKVDKAAESAEKG